MTVQRDPLRGLRVGLTGGLGSGKSTAAALFAARGAVVFSADELARTLMQPGQAVFASVVDHFGPTVLRPNSTLDRAALTELAFAGGRLEELNALIHPPTIALQNRLAAEVFDRDPGAIVMVESALIFESRHGAAAHSGEPAPQLASAAAGARPEKEDAAWAGRFDSLILVTAPEEQKIARFVARSRAAGDCRATKALEQDARRRLAQMIPDEQKALRCEFVLRNDGTVEFLEQQIDTVWNALLCLKKSAEPG